MMQKREEMFLDNVPRTLNQLVETLNSINAQLTELTKAVVDLNNTVQVLSAEEVENHYNKYQNGKSSSTATA